MAFGTSTEGDPKWWPGWIRHAVLANLCLFVFVGNCYASGITTGYAALAAEFRVGFGPLTDLTSWSVFALGVGNLFWMPLAMCIGKRIVILISMLLFMGGLIWSFKATTLDSLLAARIFASFAAGSVESIGPSMIADIYRERYFATSMALFSLFLSGGSQVGPVIAGYVVGDRGWRWFFIICTILNGFNILTCMFFLPETTYRRPYTYSGETAADIEKDATQQIENKVVQDHAERVSTDTLPNKPYAGSYWKDLYSFGSRGQERSGLKAFPKQLTLPFRFLLVPAALYATVSYGVLLGGIVLASAQIPQFFVPPPYLYDSKAIGLFTLSSFLGVIVAYPFAGPLTDLLSRFLTKRNGGIHKPEHRVPALIMPFLLCPWGLILFAYTVAEHKSQYAAAAGYAFQAAGLCLIPSVVLSYVIDAYPTESGEALVLINAGKNVVAFGVVKANVDWLASQGIKKMYAEMAGIQWAVLALAVPLYYFGPFLRAKTLRFV